MTPEDLALTILEIASECDLETATKRIAARLRPLFEDIDALRTQLAEATAKLEEFHRLAVEADKSLWDKGKGGQALIDAVLIGRET